MSLVHGYSLWFIVVPSVHCQAHGSLLCLQFIVRPLVHCTIPSLLSCPESLVVPWVPHRALSSIVVPSWIKLETKLKHVDRYYHWLWLGGLKKQASLKADCQYLDASWHPYKSTPLLRNTRSWYVRSVGSIFSTLFKGIHSLQHILIHY
jgi:hypothetical protein